MSATETKSRPILFSGEMVRAILDGRKTMTRRIIKPQPDAVEVHTFKSGSREGKQWDLLRCYNPPDRLKPCASGWSLDCPGPFRVLAKPGDLLWVRETHALELDEMRVVYKADRFCQRFEVFSSPPSISDSFWLSSDYAPARWRPSIHMPRWASRLTLRVDDVRVERLQDISEDDAEAEGVAIYYGCNACGEEPLPVEGRCKECHSCDLARAQNAIPRFRSLWESINGEGSWDANPFAWVVSFTKIDATRSPTRC